MSGNLGLYEASDWDRVLENTRHPGGLGLTRRLTELLGIGKTWSVLDIGCGMGTTAHFVAQQCSCDVVGIDRSHQLLLAAARKGFLISGDSLNLPFGCGVFDAVISECSLSLLPDKAGALQEMHRVLKVGGKLGISDIFLRRRMPIGSGARVGVDPCISGASDLGEYVQLLVQAGFKSCYVEDHSKELMKAAWSVVTAYGTMEKSLTCLGFSSCDMWREAFKQGRPGYALIVANKP